MKNKDHAILSWIVLMACVILMGSVVYNAVPKRQIAKVVGVHWITNTKVYEKVRAHSSNWYSAPKDSHNIKCEPKQHGEEYCFCVDNDYNHCRRCPVQGIYCTYDYDEWILVEDVEMDGANYSPDWPYMPTVGNNQKTYTTIRFEVLLKMGDNEVEIYRPDNMSDFTRFVIGDIWKIKFNISTNSIKPIKIIEKGKIE